MSRRLVAVLFLDLVGWTRLAERVDPEPLHQMLERYYEICSTAVEEHGGTVEKFIGDAVMAVFGASVTREDDALRALRTATQIRYAVAELGVHIHCGVASGEALVTWSSRAGLRVVGDVVNLAARLQSAAAADEVVVNETTARLVGPYYALEALEPLPLKGKADPVPAWRLGAARTTRPDPAPPMVDRQSERGRLRTALAVVARTGRPRTVAVLGPPGIGKSRLVREWHTAAPVAFGTCPSYGPDFAGTTLAEVLTALTRPGAPAHHLLAADPHLAAVLAALPLAGSQPAVEEIAWAARTVLTAAARQPLVVVWDGLEWAGPALLRTVAALVGDLRDLPLLTICVARTMPDLGVDFDDVLDVGGLGADDSFRMAALVGGEVQAHSLDLMERVTRHSAGNPLFIRLLMEAADDQVPPTVTALVGAALDRLPGDALELISRAAVVGSTFTEAQVARLGPVPSAALDVLVARQLIRRSDAAYAFVQQPVHEVCYGRLEKRERLTHHRRLADSGVSPAFHYETAVRLLTELSPDDPSSIPLAAAAGKALLDEGTVALRRRDIPAAIDLLERASALSTDGDRSVAAIRLTDAMLLAGLARRAAQTVADLAHHAAGPRDRRRYLLQHLLITTRLGESGSGGPSTGLPWREVVGDDADRVARCRAGQVRMLRCLDRGRFGAAERAARQALAHARAAGDSYEEDRLLVALCELRQWSATPITEQLVGCDELAARFADDRFLLVPVLAARARCLALIGDSAGARAALEQAAAAVSDLRLTLGGALVDQAAGLAYALEGDHRAAERRYRRAAEVVERVGQRPAALTLRAHALRERVRQHPEEPPHELAALLAQATEMDVRGRLLVLSTAVRAAAVLGEQGPADDVRVLLARTDDPCLRGDVHADLAFAARRLGRVADAEAFTVAALADFAVVGAARPAEVLCA